ncbi:hypothetical protein F5X71_00310 [Nocardia brasiliensis]|uniref:Uncharacterized protein n=1 Tax=Nocardia brasiliensis TaxID=37326 RepID=A0A6G9XJ85_NOCBR|nr:hypothetical protein [Nocardia brasiliensis]QIS00976.1 hypothetical protein F5X71_00310 [Nocardia brasiliensis]
MTELREVPSLLAELAITRAGLGRLGPQVAAGRSAETPLPIRATNRGVTMQGDRAVSRLEVAILGWTRVLAEDLRVTPYVGGPALIELARQRRGDHSGRDPGALPTTSPSQLEQAAMWLSGHRHEIRAHEAAHELLVEVSGALASIRYLVDRPVERRYLGPCPALLGDGSECRWELRAQLGASWVRCDRCRAQHDIAEILDTVRAAAEDLLYSLADLVRVTESIGAAVPKTTLYRWVRDRRLRSRAWQSGDRITDHPIDASSVQVYRLGDVLALARRGGKTAA